MSNAYLRYYIKYFNSENPVEHQLHHYLALVKLVRFLTQTLTCRQ